MSSDWVDRYERLASIRDLRPRTREILENTPPAARLDRPLWVYRRTEARDACRYDLLGFSREALLWVDAAVPSNNEISAPGRFWNHRVRSNAFGVRDALLVLVEALVECDATCITHEDCVEATLKKEETPLPDGIYTRAIGQESLALRCARGQLARLAISLPRALRIQSVKHVRDERRLRRRLHHEKGMELGDARRPHDEEEGPAPVEALEDFAWQEPS